MAETAPIRTANLLKQAVAHSEILTFKLFDEDGDGKSRLFPGNSKSAAANFLR